MILDADTPGCLMNSGFIKHIHSRYISFVGLVGFSGSRSRRLSRLKHQVSLDIAHMPMPHADAHTASLSIGTIARLGTSLLSQEEVQMVLRLTRFENWMLRHASES